MKAKLLDPFRFLILYHQSKRYSTVSVSNSVWCCNNRRRPKKSVLLQIHILSSRSTCSSSSNCSSSRAMRAASPTPTTTTRVVEVRKEIELNETEKKIFHRLLNTLRHFNLDHTVLRVAGGWVRDKLLGKESYDIDIAIDNMMGSEFVEKVREYMLSIGEEVKGVGVVACNPDQSKHLETAKIRLFDLWVDFVNLRCEDYTENSRIPTMKFGTAKEDAYRRDLTINSLFYNINTSSVEDLTGRGISDLKSRKIVTPLPPNATFLDDPLRVLRAIRFGARFDFILDEELKNAAASDEVKNALAYKVSKERIGIEIDLMISGNQPVKAMKYVSDLSLFGVVFSTPISTMPPLSEECHRLCVAYLDCAWNLIQSIGISSFTDEQRRICLYSALFLPFRKITYEDKKGKKVPIVNYVFKESLKQKTIYSEAVMKVHQLLEKFLSLIPFLTNNDTMPAEIDWRINSVDVPVTSKLRVWTGFLLREIKDSWRVALLISMMLYPTDTDSTLDILDGQFQIEMRRSTFQAVEKAIYELGFNRVWEMKPLISGNEIMKVLQLKSGGPIVREWQEKVLAWQLAYPAGTMDACLEWIHETNSKRSRVE